MVKMVGFSRAIKLDWLNKTAELVSLGKTSDEITVELNEYLSFEIKSPTVLRKTREILKRIWVLSAEEYPEIHKIALELYESDIDNKLPAHWCLILLMYPVFAEITGIIGKISEVQESFTTGLLTNRIYEIRGESTTLEHSLAKTMQTLNEFGAINRLKIGTYTVNQTQISDDVSKILLVKTILKLGLQAYYTVSSISKMPQMFPFIFSIDYETVRQLGGRLDKWQK